MKIHMYRDDWCPVHLTFSPSISEIRESSLVSAYSGGLAEYRISLLELERELHRSGIKAGVPSGKAKVRSYGSKQGANKYPEIFVNFLAFIGSAGIATVLYNVLKTWVEAKNGRKIRVRIGDFEVEATQMSEKQFIKLLNRLVIYKKVQIEESKLDAKSDRSLTEMKRLRRDLLRSGFKVSPGESYYLEDKEISSAAMTSILQARDALQKDFAKSKSSKVGKRKRRN